MPLAAQGRVRFGPFELDPRAGELHNDGRATLLHDQQLKILLMLIAGDGDVVTREDIKHRLWPNDTVVEFDHSINNNIKNLRRILGDSAQYPKYIETIASRGYRLLVPVEGIEISDAVDAAVSDSAPPPLAEPERREDVAEEAEVPRSEATPKAMLRVGRITGQMVSHYRVLELIGGGGMGLVYRAEDVKLGRAVALKFLPEEMADDPKALKRFEREAHAASALQHPNICTVYEFGEHEGQPFLAMELLKGETLRERLGSLSAAGQHLPLDQLLEIAIFTCDALGAAHERGIIHRDIKPANIFITSSGKPKILDFGLAKKTTAPDSQEPITEPVKIGMVPEPPHDGGDSHVGMTLTRTGVAIGSEGYMSPEQIRGEKLDARTDIFSLGLVLYEAAAGQRAFRGETPKEIRESVLRDSPVPLSSRNPDIPARLSGVIEKALEKHRQSRWQSMAEMQAELEKIKRQPQSGRKIWMWGALALLVIAAALTVWLYRRWHNSRSFADKDVIVVADFDNKTGDPVFDDTLKQALTIQLRQSPFLALLPDGTVNQTLVLMGRKPGEHLTAEVTREMCLRTVSKAMLTGSITALGSHYVIGLRAVNCETGDVLADIQQSAQGKEDVLIALEEAAVALRSNLGESLSSVQRHGPPLPGGDVTTRSLDAFKAFTVARKIMHFQGATAARPYLEQAVALDPNFVTAYTFLAGFAWNRIELGKAAEYAQKAYDLRDNVSGSERVGVDQEYYMFVTGEIGKRIQSLLAEQESSPQDFFVFFMLGNTYPLLGEWEKASQASQEFLRRNPTHTYAYANNATDFMALNRFDDAKEMFRQAAEHNVEGESLHFVHYLLSFVTGDSNKMQELFAAAMGKPGEEDVFLAGQADTKAWYGKMKNAHELTLRAMNSALRQNSVETAAVYQASAALREVEAGQQLQAQQDAAAALKAAPENREVRAMTALVYARAGDTKKAEELAVVLDQKYPLNISVQKHWLPTIQAAIALQQIDPRKAIELLQESKALDFAHTSDMIVFMTPVYVRGEAYLKLGDGKAAAAEFQKFIDHRGVVLNFPWGALARLELARAYAMQAETDPAMLDKTRTAYETFLALWKDADPDLPIYQQAKLEYAKLQ